MLRRKLLLILGAIVLLLLAVAVTAVLLLQGMLTDLRQVRSEALSTVDYVSRLSSEVAVIQIELYRLQSGSERHLDALLDAAEQVQRSVEQIGLQSIVHDNGNEPVYQDLRQRLPQFYRDVGTLATAQDAVLARQHNEAALSSAIAMDRDVLKIAQAVRARAEAQQEQLVARFRWIVLGMAVAFLVLINGSILLLLRAAEMVLRPIDRLVEASRALGEEKFEHRVELAQQDEFGELARAYNSLAEHLQANEQRRIEAIGQVAVTLNHELNNAMAIIELQLQLLKRSVGAEANQEKYLRQIRHSLERMTGTVEALKRVRRIVLMEYGQGTKMLDLQRSTEEEPREEELKS